MELNHSRGRRDGAEAAARFPEADGDAAVAEALPVPMRGARKRPHLMLCLIAVVCFSCFRAVYLAERPAYNYDMLTYIAVALIDAGTPLTEIHDMTYASLGSVPKQARDALIGHGDDGEFRTLMAQNADRFMATLPLASVKPLYPWLISLFYRAGVELPAASVIVSTASYALIPILLFFWFSDFASVAFAAALACCLALTPFLTVVGRLSTPDSLSILIVLMALYLSLVKERHSAAALILIFSILARPENLIYAGIFSCYLAVTRKFSLWSFAASCLAALALFFTLTRMSGFPGYTTMVHAAFPSYGVSPTPDFKHSVSPLRLKEYALIYAHGLNDLISNPDNYFGTFASLAVGAVGITLVRHAWSDKYFHMVVLASICAAVRYAILPFEFSRAFLVPYMMLLIAFVAACCSLAAASVARQARLEQERD